MSTLTRPKVRAGIAGWLASGFVVAVAFSYFDAFSLIMIGLVTFVGLANMSFTLRIHRYALLAAAFVVFVFLLGAMIGSIPDSLSNWPRWINRDGRVLAAMLPLILLGTTTRIRRPDLAMTVRVLEVIVFVNLAVFVVGRAGIPPFDNIAFARFTFSGLTSSHHAAGMVFGAAAIILTAARRSPELEIRPHILTIISALGLALGSGSRTAVVGLVVAAIWLAYERKRVTELLRVVAAVAAVGIVALALSEKLLGTAAGFLSPDLWSASWQQFTLGMESTESVHYAGGSAGGESYISNILGRFFYWGIAVGLWLRSPLVGIGSFRFNDIDMSFTGVKGFVQLATSGVDRSDELIGAHSQYFGVLVENGLLGLVLLLSIWIVPYRHIAKRVSPSERLRESGRQMVPYAFATALTGYTLVSPALTFVCLTWLALVCLYDEEEEPP